MTNSSLCQECGLDCEVLCAAMQKLIAIYTETREKEKTAIIKELRKELNLLDYEVAEDLQQLGENVISAMPELSSIIRDFDVKIGYVRSYEAKINKGKQVNADCQKVRGTYTAYLPFDFLITFYEPNVYYMTENQKKILMLHELKHIGIGEKGLRIDNHDVEDFRSILQQYGMDWNELDQDVPDILAGGDDGSKKDTNQHKMETKLKTNSSS